MQSEKKHNLIKKDFKMIFFLKKYLDDNIFYQPGSTKINM
jgi:hypothetical protein